MNRAFTSLILLTAVLTTPLVAAKSSYQLIEQAFDSGQLTYQQKLMLEIRSVKRPSSLPAEYQSATIEVNKCATEIILEAQRNAKLLSPEDQAALKDILARPAATFTYDSPGGHYKIHYNTSGSNAIPTADVAPADGVPDYAEWLATYADSSWNAEVVGLGHLQPPSDGSAGGDSKFDIYTEEMPYYGYTQPEGNGPNPWNDAYSYISVHRNFIGFPSDDDPEGTQKGAAKVTVAHEFYHAVQFAYDYTEASWFMELSSTWMEDYVYDIVNDNYNYLSDWFSYPDYSLHSASGLHMYAAFIWPKYIEQNFGAASMRQIWEQLESTTPYPALTTVLGTHGVTLNDQYAEFCSWNFITGSRDDHLHHEEASRYPLISVVRTHSSYPVSGQGPLSGKAPDAMGCNYVVFNLPGGSGDLELDFNGDNSTPWIVKVLAWKTAPSIVYQEYHMTLDGNGDGAFHLSNPEDWKYVTMVICNVSQSLNDRTYTYGASFASGPLYSVDVAGVANDSVYSNAVTSVKFTLRNLGSQPDVFNIAAGDNLGWNPVPSRSSVNLPVGGTDSVTVAVHAPALVPSGVVDSVWLTATATSTLGVSDADTSSVLTLVQRGDADNSGGMDISDVVYVISYIFGTGPAPVPILAAGDATCDTAVDISDCVYLVEFIFASGPKPVCNPL